MKHLFISLFILIVILFFGRFLLPGSYMFDFHDVSQPGRILEFAFDLTHNQIPPRIAPHMSFNMGYPLFNFYAPFSYWVTTFIHFVGFDVADSIKLSFLLAILIAGVGMFYFLTSFFKQIPSIFGAAVYAVSPYIAMEIFARGNVAEVWFFALLPLVLYLLHKNAHLNSRWVFISTSLVISFALTVHNVLSLLLLPLLVVYIFILKEYKRNVLALGLGLILSCYFLVPFIMEANFTNASAIAKLTNYKDNFLCWWQLWTTPAWGYGASNPGCTQDGISFMVGKIQIIFGLAGMIVLVFQLLKSREYKKNAIYICIALLGIISAFMSTYSSQIVWSMLPFLAVFQFPWRLLIFTLFSLSFFSAYFFSKVKFRLFQLIIPIALLFICFYQSKYFYKPAISKDSFNQLYASSDQISQVIAYRVAEYLPTLGDYSYWRSIEMSPDTKTEILNQTKTFISPLDHSSSSVIRDDVFHKKAITDSQNFILNVHYLPFWHIKINGSDYTPQKFDKLARPIITTYNSNSKIVELYFSQTSTEMVANYISAVGMITVLVLVIFWKKLRLKD